MNVKKKTWDHFKDIALNVEFYEDDSKKSAMRVKKWNKSNIDIYISGNFDNNILSKIKNIYSKIEEYTNLKFNIISDSDINNKKNNVIIYIGDYNTYIKYVSQTKNKEHKNVYGLCEVKVNNLNEIKSARIYINDKVDDNIKNDVLLEEITQSIGLLNDSIKDKKSIFYRDKVTYNSEYTNQDIEIIKLLYKKIIKSNDTEDMILKNIKIVNE